MKSSLIIIKTKVYQALKVIVYLVYILVCLLFTFLLAELTTRAYFWFTKRDINAFRPSSYFSKQIISDKRRFKSHPFLPFAPKANEGRTIYLYKPDINQVISYDYQNNSLGFRTTERPYQKAAG